MSVPSRSARGTSAPASFVSPAVYVTMCQPPYAKRPAAIARRIRADRDVAGTASRTAAAAGRVQNRPAATMTDDGADLRRGEDVLHAAAMADAERS